MLKALSGVTSHEHRERLPVIANSQDMSRLVRAAEGVLAEHPRAHGFLVAGHGLYTWGGDVREAARHLDALEFLIEVQMRAQSARLGTTT
jgi:methylthioribulose-1-phosphate dehydratase